MTDPRPAHVQDRDTGFRLTLVIVNWNGGGHLRRCVDSVIEHRGSCVDRIVVVDNGSTDGSLAACRREGVTIIESRENLGFAKACNIGARGAISEYLLFLNPDASIYDDTLERAVACLADPTNADVGICGVQLIDPSGAVARSCARFPTATAFCLGALGLSRLFRSHGVLMEDWAHDETRDVDHVIGAFYLVRRELFESLGGFDERFFVYLEDLDFSWRARQRGWRSRYLIDARASHVGGGASSQVKDRRLFYALRSRLLYAFKHFGFVSRWTVLLLTVLIEPFVRTAWAAARFSVSTLRETWKGYALLWRWLPRWAFEGETR